jgi:hypothetical protein
MESRSLAEGLLDECARDPVVDDEVEADLAERVTELAGGAVERSRLACETGAKIDDGDGFVGAGHKAR